MGPLTPSKLKVKELRDELKKLGLDTSGLKKVLVDRLTKALEDDTPGDVDAVPTVEEDGDTTAVDEEQDNVETEDRTPTAADVEHGNVETGDACTDSAARDQGLVDDKATEVTEVGAARDGEEEQMKTSMDVDPKVDEQAVQAAEKKVVLAEKKAAEAEKKARKAQENARIAEEKANEAEQRAATKRKRDADDDDNKAKAVVAPTKRRTEERGPRESTAVTSGDVDAKTDKRGEHGSGGTWVHVTGLRRPMNDHVAMTMLSSFGTVVDGSLWMSRFKSEMCAAYECDQDASTMQTSMTGTKWPPSTGGVIAVTLCASQDVNRIKRSSAGKTSNPSAMQSSKLLTPWKERGASANKEDEQKDSVKMSPNTDKGDATKTMKLDKGDATKMIKLDELFHKTQAKPVIYWLPVQPDDAERAKRMRDVREERERESRSRKSGRRW